MDLQGIVHAILTCVTAGPGLGFNRAVLFLASEDGALLQAVMAIGPGTHAEAEETWALLASQPRSLDDLLRSPPSEPRSEFQRRLEGLSIDLSAVAGVADNPLLEAFQQRRVVQIIDAARLASIPPSLREVFGGTEVVCVPMVAGDRAVGLIVADNAFTREPITEERIQLLRVLALLSGLSLDGVRLYRQLERQADELRHALGELRSTQDQLLHSERLATVGAVVARVSHEIRNPLSTIGGFARTLALHPDDLERVARNSAIIVEEVEKLETLLKEMLDFTSPRPPLLEPTDLNYLLESLANVYRDDLAERQVEFALQLAADLPPVRADRNQLQRAVVNLLRNSVQAMEESDDRKSRRLLVRTTHVDRRVSLDVVDSGPGVPGDVLPNIFTPFFTTKPRGTGLGLAVVKKIVDDHQGLIDVQSEQGVGTTIRIELPVVAR